MTTSADAKALSVGRALLALFDALGVGASSGPVVYDQSDLPPGAKTAGTYLEAHRENVKAGREGWTRNGKTRTVTAGAWALHVAEQTSKARRRPALTAAPAANDDAALDAALGIRARGTR